MDRERVATALEGWGAFGVLLLRLFDFVEYMRRPELRHVEDFHERYGKLGRVVLDVYSSADPFGVYDAEKTPGAYLFHAGRFMELWESAYPGVGGHGRIGMIVCDSFADGYRREEEYLPCVGEIMNKIWWRFPSEH